MSLYLRLVVGPVVVCDIELFAAKEDAPDPPPQLNGGSGSIVEPYVEDVLAFGFEAPRRRR